MTASALAVGEKVLALGTLEGSVHLLDTSGNEVKRYEALHSAAVTDLAWDGAGEVLATASDDGSVCLVSPFAGDEGDDKSGAVVRVEYHRPVKAVAIDPLYSRRSSRQFVAGGLAGQLILHAKGWLGARDHVLHAGEGPVLGAAWAPPASPNGNPVDLVAWANDRGVKVYDVGSQQRVAFVERPRGGGSGGGGAAAAVRPVLHWMPGGLELVIGWGGVVKVCRVRPTGAAAAADLQAPRNPKSGRGGVSQGTTAGGLARASVEVVATLGVEGAVCGVARMPRAVAPSGAGEGGALVVLACPNLSMDNDVDAGAARPEVRVVSLRNEELASDALSVRGYVACRAPDYKLVAAVDAHSDCDNIGGEALYYVLSPKDVVVACARDADDHVLWLLSKRRFEEALAECGIAGWTDRASDASPGHARRLRAATLDEVGAAYLAHLLSQRDFGTAAALCPALLRGSAEAWERWVFHFAHLRQLPALAPHIPLERPTLRPTCYEVVLNGLLAAGAGEGAHETLLECVRAWPPTLYGVPGVTAAAEARLTALEGEVATLASASAQGENPRFGARSPQSLRALREALAELYVLAGAHERALGAFLDAGDGMRALAFVRKRRLWAAARRRCGGLLRADPEAAAALLAEHREEVPPGVVVAALDADAAEAGLSTGADEARSRLHAYLHALFERDPTAGAELHGRQVELYAEFAPELLLKFLRASPYYPLEEALVVCQRQQLHAEAVYVLGRMGSAKQALQLVLGELRDVPRAVEFCADQGDDDLWDELLDVALEEPELAGELLEHAGAHLNPLRVLRRLPEGVPIPQLRDRLARIVSDFRTQSSLREGCNAILKADCAAAADARLASGRKALRVPAVRGDNMGGFSGTGAGARPRGRRGIQGSGRCCLCLEPVIGEGGAGGFVAFYCGHAYHAGCIQSAEQAEAAGKGEDSPVSAADGGAGGGVLRRCLLCTTARAARAALAAGIAGGSRAVTMSPRRLSVTGGTRPRVDSWAQQRVRQS